MLGDDLQWTSVHSKPGNTLTKWATMDPLWLLADYESPQISSMKQITGTWFCVCIGMLPLLCFRCFVSCLYCLQWLQLWKPRNEVVASSKWKTQQVSNNSSGSPTMGCTFSTEWVSGHRFNIVWSHTWRAILSHAHTNILLQSLFFRSVQREGNFCLCFLWNIFLQCAFENWIHTRNNHSYTNSYKTVNFLNNTHINVGILFFNMTYTTLILDNKCLK